MPYKLQPEITQGCSYSHCRENCTAIKINSATQHSHLGWHYVVLELPASLGTLCRSRCQERCVDSAHVVFVIFSSDCKVCNVVQRSHSLAGLGGLLDVVPGGIQCFLKAEYNPTLFFLAVLPPLRDILSVSVPLCGRRGCTVLPSVLGKAGAGSGSAPPAHTAIHFN